jgi:methylenetetrahydrofolate dehydrogenase (NADP+)/methenyltetrahydrofolate cyclohydrolase
MLPEMEKRKEDRLSDKSTTEPKFRDHRLIEGKAVQTRILAEVAEQVAAANPPVGKLVSVCIGPTPEVAVYVRNQARAAAKVGIPFDEQVWPAEITQEECKKRIQALNDSTDVLGIILQRPVPAHINVRSLQSAIHPLKDVEGMNPASIGNIVYSDIALAPCTAAASVEMLRSTGLELKGLEVVMIGHSEIVGKPAALMLTAEGATVTVCHHMTRSVAMHSRRADAVVVAVGKPHLIGPDMIKPGAAVIDIGINQVTDADGNVRIVGDVDTDAVKEVAGWITPVPGGVGPVTVAMLMRNSMVAYRRQKDAGWIS